MGNIFGTSQFRPSTTIIPPGPGNYGTLIGWNPAKVQHEPLLIQKPFVDSGIATSLLDYNGRPITSSQLTRSADDDASRFLQEALENLSDDHPAQAGQLFAQARQSLDNLGKFDDPLYIATAFGEAMWGDVNVDTLNALDRIRQQTEDPELLRNEAIIRATAYFRDGNVEAALKVISSLTTQDAPNDVRTATALMTQADLYSSIGVRSKNRKVREANFDKAFEILSNRVPSVIKRWPKDMDPTEASVQKESIAELYNQFIAFFREHGYVKFSKDLTRILTTEFTETNAAKTVVSAEGAGFVFARDGRLVPDDEISFSDRLVAAGLESIHHAHFDKQSHFWQVATLGGLAGMILRLVTSGQIDFPSAMQSMAVGATVAVGGAKVWMASSAPETKQAWKAGYTDKTPFGTFKVGSFELLKMLGTYAFFGGVLPGIGLLKDVKVLKYLTTNPSSHWGQIHGIGSFLGGLFSSTAFHSDKLGNSIGLYGFALGLDKFWENFSTTTVFGSSLKNGANFWTKLYNSILNFFGGALQLLHSEGLQGVLLNAADGMTSGGVVNSSLRAYEAVAGIYALATMVSPNLRTSLLRKSDKWTRRFEKSFFLGAYLLAGDMNLAFGVKSDLDAYTIPFLGILSQIRIHIMNGGRWNNANLSDLMRSTIIPSLYAGPGAQMLPDKHLMDKTNISHLFAGSMGAQVFLYPISLVHAALIGLNQVQWLKLKAVQSWREESVGNFGRIYFDWESFWGTAWSMVMQHVLLKPWISRTISEQVGTTSQKNSVMKLLQGAYADYEKHAKIEDPKENRMKNGDVNNLAKRQAVLMTSARALAAQYSNRERLTSLNKAISKLSPEDKMKLMPALYYVGNNTSLMSSPQRKHYRKMVFAPLMDPNTNPAAINEFLEDAKAVALDLSLAKRDMRHNLVLAIYAAKNGPHGENINKFFEQNPWLLEQYPMPEEAVPKNKNAVMWFFRNYIATPATKIMQDALIGGDIWKYWEFLQGGTLVQRSPFIFSLAFTAIRKPAPFPTDIRPAYYRKTIYSRLIDKKTPENEIKGFIYLLDNILLNKNPEFSHVKRNLILCAWAARDKVSALKEFFDRNPRIKEELSLPEGNPPQGWWETKKWFKQHLRGSTLSADGKI